MLSYGALKLFPVWDSLRGDPRFEKIVASRVSKDSPNCKVKSDNFFTELKRRNVYKVAVAYIVVGWALSHGIAQVFPFFEIPNWVMRLVVVLIIIGFPIALVIAWAFELTPEGIKRTENVDAMPASTRNRRNTPGFMSSYGAGSRSVCFFSDATSRRTAADATAQFRQSRLRSCRSTISVAIRTTPTFAEGVQDEILTRLANVADLKVISRTSTQQYKSAPDNLARDREAARRGAHRGRQRPESGRPGPGERAAHQCADRRASLGGHLRSQTDRHLRGRKRDRENHCRHVAGETDRLGEKFDREPPTANPEAYELYLKGRFFWNKRTGDNLRKAIEYFNQAIAKDPNYALAYVGSGRFLCSPSFLRR